MTEETNHHNHHNELRNENFPGVGTIVASTSFNSVNLTFVEIASNSDNQISEIKTTNESRKRKVLNMFRLGKVEVKKIQSIGWIILLGDAIHNFAGIKNQLINVLEIHYNL
jgi:ERCC4-type nuclease